MRFDITHYWYQDKTNVLLPLSWLFAACVAIRRFCYRKGLFKVARMPVPVIIVGNITAGGTGKTPFVIWLANWLREQGYKPGIVSRGLGGKTAHRVPYRIQANDEAERVGDEARLLTRQTNCPMVVCTNRARAARELLEQTDCDVVISDDGLQHYGLARDIEIVMIDGERQFGNGCLLPAGPLREAVSRLDEVDMVVVNGTDISWIGADRRVNHQAMLMQLELSVIRKLVDDASSANPSYAKLSPAQGVVHAVAAIGNPDRFFHALRHAGFTVIPHAFPDHYRYQEKDLDFNDDLPIIMTAKDAVKCESFAKENWWVADTTTKMDERIPELLLLSLRRSNPGTK